MFEDISKANLWFGGFVLGFVIGFLCMLSIHSTTSKDTYNEEIIELKEQITDDSLMIQLLQEETNRLEEENQRFGSMLTEKENEKTQ